MMRPLTEQLVWTTVIWVGGVTLIVWICWRLSRWLIGKTFKRMEDRSRGTHCVCGYPLQNLNVPRCPECGRVIGFNATAEELGLTNEQLQRAKQTKDEREKNWKC